MQRHAGDRERLLGGHDPDPVVVRDGSAAILLTVEHAGRDIPEALDGLGLPGGELDRHIGWDIGAFDLAMALSERLSAPMIAQRYSRLVIDANRPWDADDLIPSVSDGTPVPANRNLDDPARRQRWDEIHRPFHAEVDRRCVSGMRALVAIHTYDAQRRVDRAERPWPIGLLSRKENTLSMGLARLLMQVEAATPLGINQPYEIEDHGDYTIPVHAEPRSLPHVLVEVRNDFVRDDKGVSAMADILAEALEELELT